jgi:hypothetical protein
LEDSFFDGSDLYHQHQAISYTERPFLHHGLHPVVFAYLDNVWALYYLVLTKNGDSFENFGSRTSAPERGLVGGITHLCNPTLKHKKKGSF